MPHLLSQVVRLAATREDLRPHLLAALQDGKVAREFGSPDAWKAYLEKHPKADPANHEFSFDKGPSKSKESPAAGKIKVDVDPKEIEKRRPKIESEDLSAYPPNADAEDLAPEHQEEIKDYKLTIVGEDARQAVEIARKIRQGIQKGSDICKLNPPVCEGNLGLTRDKMPQIEGGDSVKKMLSAMPKDEYNDLSKKVRAAQAEAKKDGKKFDLADVIGDKKQRGAWLDRAKGEAMVQAGADPDDDRTVLQQMLDHLSDHGVRTSETEIPVGMLKATQAEIKADKTYGMADSHLKGKFDNIDSSVVVSRDGHILDGHHRWAALLTIDPSRKMKVKVIDMDMKDLLEEAQAVPGVYTADFEGTPLEEDAQKSYKSKAKSKLKKPHKSKKKDASSMPTSTSTRVARLLPRQEAILQKYLASAGGSRAATGWDELPDGVRAALRRVKDQETLWMDVDRWFDDNAPASRFRWASDEAQLYSGVIRLAAMEPTFRPHLLPLLRVAMEFATPDALSAYMKAHPGADPKNHSVKSEKGDDKDKEKRPAAGGHEKHIKDLPASERRVVDDMPTKEMDKNEAYRHPQVKAKAQELMKLPFKTVQRLYNSLDKKRLALSEAHMDEKDPGEKDTIATARNQVQSAWRATNVALQEMDRLRAEQEGKSSVERRYLPRAELKKRRKIPAETTKKLEEWVGTTASDPIRRVLDEVRQNSMVPHSKLDKAISHIETLAKDPHHAEDKEDLEKLADELAKATGRRKGSDFRTSLIRLAHAEPTLRPHLLPLLRAGTRRQESPYRVVFQVVQSIRGPIIVNLSARKERRLDPDVTSIQISSHLQEMATTSLRFQVMDTLDGPELNYVQAPVVPRAIADRVFAQLSSTPTFIALKSTFQGNEWVILPRLPRLASTPRTAGKVSVRLDGSSLSVEDIEGTTPWGERIGQVAYLDTRTSSRRAVREALDYVRKYKNDLERESIGGRAIGAIEEHVFKATGLGLRWQYVQLPM